MTRTRARICAVAALAIGWLAPIAARADIERYALVVGNNLGDSDEQRLRYAEDDARRVYEVLRELGGFRPENMLLLRSEDAESVRRSLISINDRIRTRVASGAQSELLVYYSGHSDQTALHLGRTALELEQVEQLVRGSAATLRVLILDSCRSGALTRVKGGAIQPGFQIALDQRIPSDGVVFWTASSASETAQESDALRGSFFTHYLVSGLLGAADRDGNGDVTLGEAYQYAYENTLRASSRTLGGMQHPTFRYELGGHGDVVMTLPGRADDQRAQLSFPDGKSYLVIQGGADGAVMAEVGAHDRTRRLSVKPGRYFVRGRGPDFLLEGTVVLRPAEQRQVREDELERLDYARLVRKGRDERRVAAGVQAGYALRTALWSGGDPCQGPFASYAIDLPLVSVAPRIGACRGGFDDAPGATSEAIELEVRAAHAWDFGHLALSAGGSVGGSYMRDKPGNGRLSSKQALPYAGVLVGATVDLTDGYYCGVELDGMAYFQLSARRNLVITAGDSILTDVAEPAFSVATSRPFALRIDLVLIGKRW
ncbi:MAG TPA: caspase family protein [Kofleriaceae bacterium]|nr:caspase family protein [Kofleriaceae bacterium]